MMTPFLVSDIDGEVESLGLLETESAEIVLLGVLWRAPRNTARIFAFLFTSKSPFLLNHEHS